MLTNNDLYPFQQRCVNFILKQKRVGLFLNMGMGKTVIALTAAAKLIFDNKIKKVLVIAPKSVAQNNWHTELRNWEHLKHLTYSKVMGSESDRLAALNTTADIYIIGRDNVAWLKASGFDKFGFIIIDESSSFKNHKSKRFQALVNFKYLYAVLLTGTPIPNGFTDLWSQIFLLDHGRLLGKYNKYINEFFTMGKFGGLIEPSYDKKIRIKKLISDITISIDNKTAKIEYPKVIYKNHYLELDNDSRNKYEKFITTLKLDSNVSAINPIVLIGKLLQFCNGCVYSDEDSHKYTTYHQVKIEALKELIETSNNVLVVYNFKSDLERLTNSFKEARIFNSNDSTIVEDWNNGKIKILLCHPASAGMGLNLQFGGNIIIWFSLTWNLEHYLQFNARLDRPGQKKNVLINHLIIKDTIEEVVLKSLMNKENIQDDLLNYLT